MMTRSVCGAERLGGSLRMPGDKSIAHRALIFGALARGVQRVSGLPDSEDVASTARCLEALGCRVERDAAGGARVQAPPSGLVDSLEINAGNSGTTARLLAGLIAGWGRDVTIDGDASLRTRPMRRVADPLLQMGAEISTRGGCLPMRIRAAGLRGISARPSAASAQVKSAILIAGLLADGETTVVERAATRDHTERMLTAMGVEVVRRGLAVSVTGGAAARAVEIAVPGDISSAAFFLVAAAIVPAGGIVLHRTGVNPTRTGILDVLTRMGARVALRDPGVTGGEPVADLAAGPAELRGVEIGGELIPRLIDELPVLAVAATQARGETVVRDAGELRHKESDRIRLTVDNLRAMGARIEERPDGFVVQGPCELRGAPVEAGGDHRIAMALAVAGLVAAGETTIAGSEAVAISYPAFFRDLESLTRG